MNKRDRLCRERKRRRKRVTDGIYFSTTQQLSWIIRMKGNKYDAVSNNPSPCSTQGNAHPSSLRGKA